jgi:hypothetical protein
VLVAFGSPAVYADVEVEVGVVEGLGDRPIGHGQKAVVGGRSCAEAQVGLGS